MTAIQSFSKARRLTASAEFRFVFQQRNKVGAPKCSLHIADNQLTYSRLGITVSKKVSKRAVQRNRIKRLAREFFRHNLDRFPGKDLVFTAYPGCAELANQDLVKMLDKLFIRAEKRCKNCA